MLCDKCGKNEATYFSKTTINGVTTEKHLCNECVSGEDFGPMLDFGRDIIDPFGFISDDTIFDYYRPFSIENSNNDILSQALDSVKIGAKNEKLRNNSELIRLKNELKDAVDREDYETACKLKKQIDEINDQNGDNK